MAIGKGEAFLIMYAIDKLIEIFSGKIKEELERIANLSEEEVDKELAEARKTRKDLMEKIESH